MARPVLRHAVTHVVTGDGLPTRPRGAIDAVLQMALAVASDAGDVKTNGVMGVQIARLAYKSCRVSTNAAPRSPGNRTTAGGVASRPRPVATSNQGQGTRETLQTAAMTNGGARAQAGASDADLAPGVPSTRVKPGSQVGHWMPGKGREASEGRSFRPQVDTQACRE